MDVTITDSRLVALPTGVRLWVSAVAIGGGLRIQHVMPEDTLEIRAAEYGFDPDDDRDDLLEIVIREPLMPDPPGWRDNPRHLWNATDAAESRALLRERFLGVGRLDSRSRRPNETRPGLPRGAAVLLDNDDDPDEPLPMLRREMPASPDRMDMWREVTAETRRRLRAQQVAATDRAGAARRTAAGLRAARRPRLGADRSD